VICRAADPRLAVVAAEMAAPVVATAGVAVRAMLGRGWPRLRQHGAEGYSRHEKRVGDAAGSEKGHFSGIRMMAR
jgi:hypothetical protein